MLRFFITFIVFLTLANPVHARMIEGTDESETQSEEDVYVLSLEELEEIIEAEKLNLRDLEIQHKKNLDNLPTLENIPEGQENSDEIRKLALFIMKFMMDGNHELQTSRFDEKFWEIYFGERAYGQLQSFTKESTEGNIEEDTYYLLESQCVPHVDEVSVGKTSKRWKLAMLVDYIQLNNFDGSLLVLESDIIPEAQKRNKTKYWVYMDIRNRKKDNGKDKYQFRNIHFKEIVDETTPNISNLLECSDRDKVLHEIAMYDLKAAKAKGRIDTLKQVAEFLNSEELMEELIDLESAHKPFGELDLHLP